MQAAKMLVVGQSQIGTGGNDLRPEEAYQSALQGNRRGLSRVLTMIENGDVGFIDDSKANSSQLNPHLWQVLGVTGAPGVGKSCLVDRIIQHWLKKGFKVAILAVDPSSPLTGGALLGDRLRMSNSVSEDNVFFRSVATRKHGGSVPGVVATMIKILKQCGWDKCIVETVGAGQGEMRVAAVADRIILVEAPGRGDGVQAEKAGLIELADLIVVNKADLDGAQKCADEIRQALQAASSIPPNVHLASAATGEGMEDLLSSIDRVAKRKGMAKVSSLERIKAVHEQRLLDSPYLEAMVESVNEGMDPAMALKKLEEQVQQNTDEE